MYFVSPIGTLKSSEMAPQKTVELSSVPTMLVLFFTTEAVDSETVTSIVAVTTSQVVVVMVTV